MLKRFIVYKIKGKKKLKKYKQHIHNISIFLALIIIAVAIYSTNLYLEYRKISHIDSSIKEITVQDIFGHSNDEKEQESKNKQDQEAKEKAIEKAAMDAINQVKEENEIILTKDDLMGKVQPRSISGFIRIPTKYVVYRNSIVYVRKQAWSSFAMMAKAAQSDGVTLKIASGLRTFSQQRSIWQAKWNNLGYTGMTPIQKAKVILTYSAMPGASRHHWGTDIDINSVQDEYFQTKQGKRTYEWLKKNAHLYGFCQTYRDPHGLGDGHGLEQWHWSYIPLASKFLEQYKDIMKSSDIRGFTGSEQAKNLDILNKYILNISEDCKIRSEVLS